MTVSAPATTVGDFKQFGAWLGPVPRQNRTDKISQWLVQPPAKVRVLDPNYVSAKPGEVAPISACDASLKTHFRTNKFFPVDMHSKMHHTGQTSSRQARLTLYRAHGGDGGE